ncbi:spermidine/putrescine ABC transporter ATPase [Burkholderia aenigmatica]|uniref:Spermidine/putrescine ABC transporter ATPase n=1 Tax=Burkholderia aenigmatica TaxID=2015348 RepID=A0A6J5IWV6_9BURK|nr:MULTISPECIES: ABC transporter ATP-binding protein [Burkholderia]AYQ43087.1 polyamine ABC transporter ATP-binding protein [Burkholderia lata]CAB3964215.1 spermidine/putrescine ABC transporter ATPase [Burkholderia aenigmatica]VWC41759.1 spermidine/putrescine ABC transporter ATPase [Burkholderia aenigmatica]
MSAVMETSAGVEEGRHGAEAARTASAARIVNGAGLQIDRVSKRYGSVHALRETSIEIPRGEFLTILGPSGSGKTTLLTIVAGFEHPTTGDLRVGGRSIVALPPEKRNFGMVFQGYALFPHMTVEQNVAYPLMVRKQKGPDAVKRVKAALDLVRLGHLADRLPRQLSGGQQQRVAIARALVFDPDLVLLDEPLGALDRKLRGEVQVELKALHERLGATFLFVTHDQEEALSMSDRIAIMRDGRLEQIGTPDGLYEQPANRFVADFLGKSNFIEGVALGGDAAATHYRVGDARFVAPACGARADDTLLFALRPEKVAVSATSCGGAHNEVAGRIRHWSYFGSSYRFEIETSALGCMTADVPAWRGLASPRTGMDVFVQWERDATCRIAAD